MCSCCGNLISQRSCSGCQCMWMKFYYSLRFDMLYTDEFIIIRQTRIFKFHSQTVYITNWHLPRYSSCPMIISNRSSSIEPFCKKIVSPKNIWYFNNIFPTYDMKLSFFSLETWDVGCSFFRGAGEVKDKKRWDNDLGWMLRLMLGVNRGKAGK